ncbi:FAD-binding oxidoreductase [Nocardioides bruguierae]|uniref:FAD-binding oxidoreductase n=1 Tax=Nocardioides bruguierae TaxID=2945102 RepID=UPI00201FC1E4|nr:FAD-binding oxidoreductase [Nocardioides bruguierae]MCL8025102.1 FAD-binding oxidoreductase [Nocardioides bruguierae]
MSSTSLSPQPGVEALRRAAPGRVHLPGEAGYDAARTPWNLAAAQHPAVVAEPTSVEEVRALVDAARTAGLRIVPQTTGHAAAALGGRADGALLLQLRHLRGVEVDPAARTARVLGGTTWQEVVAAAAPHGLTAAHGSAGDVGVVGYALSGGLSFYGRRHGLAVEHVRAVELVLPTGELVRATVDVEPDLFWACRGAAATLGVVTAVEIDLLPYPDVHAGMLLWDAVHAAAVLPAWLSWTEDLPESVTTSLRVMSFPPLPELPPFLSGRSVVVVDGAVLEDDDVAGALLAPLRALDPEMDTFTRMPAPGLLEVHMDPPTPTPATSVHALLGPLDADGVAAVLAAATTPSPLLFTELRHLGGALARSNPEGGALTSLPGSYLLHCVGAVVSPEVGAAARAAGEGVHAAMRPWHVDGAALTFVDDVVEGTGSPAQAAFCADALRRLRIVRSVYDPTDAVVAARTLD